MYVINFFFILLLLNIVVRKTWTGPCINKTDTQLFKRIQQEETIIAIKHFGPK